MVMSKDRFVHYTTGIADMDDQHWELFKEMDDLVVRLKAQDYLNIVEKLLQLSILMAAHFRLEDALMESVSYPFINEHQLAHATQMTHLTRVQSKAQNNTFFSDAYISETSELLVKHVDAHDIQLANYLMKFNLTGLEFDATITP